MQLILPLENQGSLGGVVFCQSFSCGCFGFGFASIDALVATVRDATASAATARAVRVTARITMVTLDFA
jgi:hypothetical protein